MTRLAQFNKSATYRFITTVVIGAGQAGLAMSHCLTADGIDHVVLERGEVANSWKTERWDSLSLLSPNWQTRLPGVRHLGDDPDGFMSCADFIHELEKYSRNLSAPIHAGVNVEQVSRTQNGYRLVTNQGEWQCRTLVLASGVCNIPVVPKIAEALPDSIYSINAFKYRNPSQLPDGGVLIVGASASGLQLASEIQQTGRQVLVSAGEQVRMPRRYRGKDIQWWMDQSGLLDLRYDQVDDINRSRRLPSSQLVGGNPPKNLDINTLQEEGIEFVGRAASVFGNKMQFSGSLANVCKMADLKLGRLLKAIDDYIDSSNFAGEVPAEGKPESTRISDTPRLELDLGSGEISTVIWATGYRPDYSWLKVPVLDHKGMLRHDGGVVDSPGLYAMGLPFMRRRKSQFIDGVGNDARELSAHMGTYLHGRAAA